MATLIRREAQFSAQCARPNVSRQFAVQSHLLYDSLAMANASDLRCDGCGQLASAVHVARRLRRLEWATRYRPVHIQALLLGAIAPREDADYLYAPGEKFRGEAAQVLRAIGISFAGRPSEQVHAEFQGAGLFLAHVLECSLENFDNAKADAANLLREHLPSVASRIRRSLKPKRVILVTEIPQLVVQDMLSMDLGCPVVLNDEKPFAIGATGTDGEISRFRAVLDSKATR